VKPPEPSLSDYATVRLTHHALSRERAERLRQRGPRSRQPECLVVGHAWTEDAGRHGGTICLVCQVIRWP
jgi:hypothetical protein